MPKIKAENYISSLECKEKGVSIFYGDGLYKITNNQITKSSNSESMSESVYKNILDFHKNSDNYVKFSMLITSFMNETEFFGNVGENFDYDIRYFRKLYVERYIKKSELHKFELDINTNLLYSNINYESLNTIKRKCLGQILTYDENSYIELIKNTCNILRKEN